MVCVECGKETDRLVEGACIECFVRDKPLMKLPHHVDLQVCTNCGEFALNKVWSDKEVSDAAEEAALEKLSVIKEARILSVGSRISQQDPRTFKVDMEADLEIRGTEVRAEADTMVRLKNTVCKRCSRQLGNYYEAILQIRSDGNLEDSLRDEVVRKIRNEVESLSRNDRRLFITSVSEVTGGIDMKLSSIAMGKNLSRELADRYGAESKVSSSLAVQAADGSDTYRVTYLVRLPEHRVGDAVTFDGKLYKLTYISKNGGKLLALQGFKHIFVPRADMVRVRVYRKREEMRTATVIFSEDGEAEILHPGTLEPVLILTPKGEKVGETVRFVDLEGEILYVP